MLLFDEDNTVAFAMASAPGCPSLVLNTTMTTYDDDNMTLNFDITYALLPNATAPSALPSAGALRGVATQQQIDLLAVAGVAAAAAGGAPPPANSSCRVVYDWWIVVPPPTGLDWHAAALTLESAEGCPAYESDPCFTSGWVYSTDTFGNLAAFSMSTQPGCPGCVSSGGSPRRCVFSFPPCTSAYLSRGLCCI